MPQVEITIGGRSFEVACQDGEEHFLRTASALLDEEAQHLSNQIGRMPEARMLLMSGLMLADRTAGIAERLQEAERALAHVQAQLSDMQSRPPERVEVPVIPAEVTDSLAEIAARAESLADDLDGNV
ncbi:cell division protein ZapA [Loktanella sp. SALINAS62]|uniref:cell division protein ZapA n=1 Tax=Loktanella sp. SALINAS62 TaxID=2706124 RepID=UPI001B8D72D2|nr:cell division protein ZapA [Loktanella sp. SALINAS62]MBS1301640.1 cell division protein ZapA [Loktanella sp. SALINAS62]